MKKHFLQIILALLPFVAPAQTVYYDIVKIAQRLELFGNRVTSFSKDTTLATASDTQIASALAIKSYIANHAGDLSPITGFISAGVGNPPAASPSGKAGQTWRNNSTGELWRSNGSAWGPASGVSESRTKSLSDSLDIAATYNHSGRFIAARKANKPLVVGFMGDSQFDRYYRNVKYFFAADWASEFTPNGPGYCAASTQAANVEGYGFNAVSYIGTWTEANTITNAPPIVEEGLNGRYAENSSGGSITFSTASVIEWSNVEKFDSLRIYTKANGAEYDIAIDGTAYTAHVVTANHGGVHVVKVGGLAYSAHSVKLTQTVGTLRVYGVSAYSAFSGALTIQRFAQGSSSFESWANRFSDTSYISKIRTLYPVPQVVFCNLGSNDYLDGGNLDSLKGHMVRFITKFKQFLPATDLVLVTPMDGTINSDNYRKAFFQVSKQYKNVLVADLQSAFGDHANADALGYFEADHVHWSPIGAKLASPLLLRFIVPIPKIPAAVSPGGANRSIQYNNNGVFGGLSEIRVPSSTSFFLGVNAGASASASSARSYGIGTNALQSAIAATDNIAIGSNAGQNVTSSLGIYIGKDACKGCAGRGGSFGNVVIGNNSLTGVYSGSAGNDNFIIGNTAGQNIDSGNNNTILGNNSGNAMTSGFTNVLIGPYTGQLIGGGFSNVLIGALTGNGISSGWQNIVFGRQALGSANPSNAIIIGHQAAGSSSSADNSIVIGFQAGQNSAVANKLWLQNSNSTTPLLGGDFSTGKVGIKSPNANPFRDFDVNGEVRITDLTTDPPTRIVGADADGDLGAMAINSTLAISGGTLSVPSLARPTGEVVLGNGADVVSYSNFNIDGAGTLNLSIIGSGGNNVITNFNKSGGVLAANFNHNHLGTSSNCDANLNVGVNINGGDPQTVYTTNLSGSGNTIRTGIDNSDADIYKQQYGTSLTGTPGYQQNTANEIAINATPVSGVKFLVSGVTRLNLGSDATGDSYYRNSSGNVTRLPIGSTGNVLTVSGGVPTWAPPAAGMTVQIDTFTTSRTWTKLASAKYVYVVAIAGGSGGSSGNTAGTGVFAYGGSGGGSGGRSEKGFSADVLPSTVSVLVGAGGAGGAAQSSASSAGNPGVAGGISGFGKFLYALAGTGGDNASGGDQGRGLTSAGEFGGSGTDATGVNGACGPYSSGSGAAGGGINALNAASAGGSGSGGLLFVGATGGNGAAGTSGGGAGGNGGVDNDVYIAFGGGGGGSSISGNGGAGGNGVAYGAGGGGGGAARNGNSSGAGGKGAGGFVVVVTYY